MTTYTLTRDGDTSLVFEGELIGEGSSRRGNSPRWFEAKIYRTAAGSYVVSGTGRSEVEGETDRRWAVVCDDGYDVVAALQRDELRCADCGNDFAPQNGACECGSYERETTGVRFLTKTARDAIAQAATRDPEIRDASVERVA